MADIKKNYGRVAKLVDALDLGSSAFGMGVRVSSRPPYKRTSKGVLFLLQKCGQKWTRMYLNFDEI